MTTFGNGQVFVYPPVDTIWEQVDIYAQNYGQTYLTSNVMSSSFLYTATSSLTITPASGSAAGGFATATIANLLGDPQPAPGVFATKVLISGNTSYTAYSQVNSSGVYIHIPAAATTSSTGSITLIAMNGFYNTYNVFTPMNALSSSAIFTYVPVPMIASISGPVGTTTSSQCVFDAGGGAYTSITGTNFDVNAAIYLRTGNVLISPYSQNWYSSSSMSFVNSLISPFYLSPSTTYDVLVVNKGVVTCALTSAYKVVPTPMFSVFNTPLSIPSTTGSPGREMQLLAANYYNYSHRLINASFVSGVTQLTLVGQPTGGTYFFPGSTNTASIYASNYNVTSASQNSYNLIFDNMPSAVTGVYGTVIVSLSNSLSGVAIGSPSSTSSIRYELLPTITSINPTFIPTVNSSLTTVGITGTGLLSGYTQLNVNGTIVPLTVDSTTTAHFSPPNAYIPQFVNMLVSNGSVKSNTISLEYRNELGPQVLTLSPNGGVINTNQTMLTMSLASTSVGVDVVTYNGVSCSYTAGTPMSSYTWTGSGTTTYKLMTPADSPGIVSVTVGNASGTDLLTVERVSIPTISSIYPQPNSPIVGGSGYTIFGTNFNYANPSLAINFGTSSLTGYSVANSTTITNVTFPAAPDGNYNIVVTNKLTGSSTGSGIPTVTIVEVPVITAISGYANDILGGTVYLSGTGFYSGSPWSTSIQIGSVIGTKTSTSYNAITATIGAQSASSYNTTVINDNLSACQAISASSFTYVHVTSSIITSLSTATISTLGDVIVINASPFQSGAHGVFDTIYLDGATSCSSPGSGSSWISATIPAHAAGNGNLTLQSAYGTSNSASLTFVSVPTITAMNIESAQPSWIPYPEIASNSATYISITGTNFLTTPGATTFNFRNVSHGGNIFITPVVSSSTTARFLISSGTLPSGYYRDIVVSNMGVAKCSATLGNAIYPILPNLPNITSATPATVSSSINQPYFSGFTTVSSSYLKGDELYVLSSTLSHSAPTSPGVLSGSTWLEVSLNAYTPNPSFIPVTVTLINGYGTGSSFTIPAT